MILKNILKRKMTNNIIGMILQLLNNLSRTSPPHVLAHLERLAKIILNTTTTEDAEHHTDLHLDGKGISFIIKQLAQLDLDFFISQP
jgi:hypothetical protein